MVQWRLNTSITFKICCYIPLKMALEEVTTLRNRLAAIPGWTKLKFFNLISLLIQLTIFFLLRIYHVSNALGSNTQCLKLNC